MTTEESKVMKLGKSGKYQIPASNLTSFLWAFCMTILIPIENYFHGALSTILIIIVFLSSFILFVKGTGDYSIKGFNKRTFYRIASTWVGMLVGAPFSMYIEKLLRK